MNDPDDNAQIIEHCDKGTKKKKIRIQISAFF